MLNNKQRAHDLTIALLNTVIASRVDDISKHKTDNTGVNVYGEYMSLYNQLLVSFNKDFPCDED